MADVFDKKGAIDSDFESERAVLLKRAAEKPTLRMINAAEARPIQEWEESQPGLALFIEVTREESGGVDEGRLIATAESSVEFLDLGNEYEQRGIVNLTTYGKQLGDEPMCLPTAFWLSPDQQD